MKKELLLESIKTPSDLKNLPSDRLSELSEEIREAIIETVSKNGGHLASNLGMVEPTVVLHRVFDSPKDKIIFDVGHQCYAHKLLTGRYDRFSTIRKFGGLSGFTNPKESEHDVFYEGHSGTSVSAALGIATANKLRGDDSYTVAVVGDGSLTNGMIYEALNNCSDSKLNLIIIINDNEMSISSNVGGLHNYLSRLRISKGYFTFKRGFERWLLRIPMIGKPLAKFFKLIKDAIKHVFVKDTIFEDLGIVYLGPVDGNDTRKLSIVLEEAKLKHQCCVIHMRTLKGMGYRNAENRPDRYHSVGSFDVDGGIVSGGGKTMSEHFGEVLLAAAREDKRICAITAAMCDGTGLRGFAEEFPERFFDVGIAEEHAVTFASGLAAGGFRPVVAMYSTFSQRVCDQLIHDVALQGLPLVLALDRCGFVAGDGITHQGIFDYPLFSSIPGTVIYSCADADDTSEILPRSVSHNGLTVMRYPKGRAESGTYAGLIKTENFSYTENIKNCDVIIVTHGRMTATALEARRIIGEGKVGVIKLLRVFPLDAEELAPFVGTDKIVYVLDEGGASGGIAEKLSAGLGIKIHGRAIEDFVEHGDLNDLYSLCGFDAESVVNEIKALISKPL